jgi:uncharacterized protein (TIGR02646 family)
MISVRKDFDKIPDCLKSEKVRQAISDVIKDPLNYDSSIIKNTEIFYKLNAIYDRKCAFCQSLLVNEAVKEDFILISHYRPRNQYSWLSYEWSNLLLCCEACQLARRTEFPLDDESKRIKNIPERNQWSLDSTVLRQEQPLLLNPEIDRPEDHFYFDINGKMNFHTTRGEVTIRICKLNRPQLTSSRGKIIKYYTAYIMDATRQARNKIFLVSTQKEKESIVRESFHEIFQQMKHYKVHSEFSLLRSQLIDNFDIFFTNSFSDDIDKRIVRLAFDLMINEFPVNFDSLHQENIKIKSSPELPEIPSAYINSVSINKFLFIENISLNLLKEKREIYFLGENGDGKTLLLQAILTAFKGHYIISQTAIETGAAADLIRQSHINYAAKDSKNNEYYPFNDQVENLPNSLKNIYAYGVQRRAGRENQDLHGFMTLFDDSYKLIDPAEWLTELDRLEAKKKKPPVPFAVAVKILEELLIHDSDENRKVRIIFNQDEKIEFTEHGNPVAFNQLSEGYKSVMTWVCDLLSRLAENQSNVTDTKDYQGVVLVDEIDLHLHPKWAYSIVKKLRSWFPNIQFFFTTHSPIVILGASDKAVFYKVYKEEGITKISEPVTDISEYVANSLITSPLFDLETMATRSFNKKKLENLSSDDFIYKQIHKAIATRMKENPSIMNEEEIHKWVKEELDKLENVK